ncbi:MAG TPA: TetR/AcrR family transcriptional regulator [Gammaproteobacteria bacterium]|jgi:AcrR family transcriptional regulator
MSSSSPVTGTLTDIGPRTGQSVSLPHRAILAAAKECFVRKGFEAVTLTDIAQSARIPEAELQREYAHKSKLLMGIFDEAWALINPRIAEIIATSRDARSAMSSILSTAVSVYQKDRALVRLMLLEAYRPQPGTNRVATSRGYFVFVEMMTALAERGQREGHFKTSFHPRVITSVIVAVGQGVLRDALLAEEMGGANLYAMPQLVAAFESVIASLGP